MYCITQTTNFDGNLMSIVKFYHFKGFVTILLLSELLMKIQGCPSGSPLSMKLLMPACLLLVMPPPKCFLFVVQHIFVWKMIFLVYVSFRLA